MNMHDAWWKKLVGMAAIVIVAGAVLGWVTALLWNWLMPAIFGLGTITFWQGLGLFVLSRLLLGGLRGFGRQRHHRHRWHERWRRMSPQERETFSRGLHSHCRWSRGRRDEANSSQAGGA